MASSKNNQRNTNLAARWQKLTSLRIFFGHQSVGDNILRGLQCLRAGSSLPPINVISSDHPAAFKGPALVEWHIGRNADPSSKDAAFRKILDQGFGQQGGIACYKYCFVDIGDEPEMLFQSYCQNISAIRTSYPNLVLVHVTIPLTTVEPAWKAWTKRKMGRQVERDAAIARHRFNQLLRARYLGSEPIFDLAAVESTRPDGSRSFFAACDQMVETLVAEYTDDGGHLNQPGQRAAATGLLLTLSQI